MKNAITSGKFFGGGNAVFTVSNPAGTHFTYRISQPKGDNKPFFIGLTGGEGSGQGGGYQYMGIYKPGDGSIILTKKSKFNLEDLQVKVVVWATARILANKPLPAGYAVQHEGKCCCCGRELTTDESISAGIGPDCAKRYHL